MPIHKEVKKEFFKYFGVREEVITTEIIEDFAEVYIKRKLRKHGYEIISGPGDGYDLKVRKGDEELYIEVKGRRRLSDIDLTPDQTKKAIEYKDRYIVIIVFNIPNEPRISFIRDPAREINFKLTISKEMILQHIWQPTIN